ncbi:MAG: hypothetical protein GF403_00445 [Candidatus Coatesbacteria bacterium]|nr:hypothetical protein [Candidatus Coatesbacteria bacterium]
MPRHAELPLLIAVLLLTACGDPPPPIQNTSVVDSRERWDEVRERAEELLPGARLYEVLGMDSGGEFGDGLCGNWIYSFHSPNTGELLRVYLSPSGLVEAPFPPEKLLPGQGPPAWPAEPELGSRTAAEAALRDAGEELNAANGVRLESYRLTTRPGDAERRLVWEVTLYIDTPLLDEGEVVEDPRGRILRRVVDAVSGEPLN